MRVEIEKFLNNGFGLTRNSAGEVVFVAGALPGETVSINPDHLVKKRGVIWAHEYVMETSSTVRTNPNCLHFHQCGGCSTLHIQNGAELELKTSSILDTLARVGKWRDPQVKLIDFPGEGSRFRGKFHANGRKLGWKAKESNDIVALEQCHVLPKSLQKMLPSLRRCAAITHFKGVVYFSVHPQSHRILLSFHGPAHSIHHLAKLYKSHDAIAGISHYHRRGRLLQRWGDATLQFDWLPFTVNLGAEHFFQANPHSWNIFHTILRNYLDRFQPTRVWDVHAGSGFLTSGLAGKTIYASEPDPTAFENLAQNLKRLKWKSHLFPGTAAQALASEPWRQAKLDGLLLDPPRVGLDQALRDWIIEAGPATILYYSCDIGTFARDFAQLSQVYQPISPLRVLNVNAGTLRTEIAVTLIRQNKVGK